MFRGDCAALLLKTMYLLPEHLRSFGASALCAQLVFKGPGKDQLFFTGSLHQNPPKNFELIGVVGVFEAENHLGGEIVTRGINDDAEIMRLIRLAGYRFGNSLRALGMVQQFEIFQ